MIRVLTQQTDGSLPSGSLRRAITPDDVSTWRSTVSLSNPARMHCVMVARFALHRCSAGWDDSYTRSIGITLILKLMSLEIRQQQSCINSRFVLIRWFNKDVNNSAFSPDQSVLNVLLNSYAAAVPTPPPSLVRYTNRPFGHGGRCKERLTMHCVHRRRYELTPSVSSDRSADMTNELAVKPRPHRQLFAATGLMTEFDWTWKY